MIESISLTPAPPGPPERYIIVGPLVFPTRARRSGTVPGSAPVRSSGTVSEAHFTPRKSTHDFQLKAACAKLGRARSAARASSAGRAARRAVAMTIWS